MRKISQKPLTRLSTLYLGGVMFFVLVAGSAFYFINYTKQITQKEKIEVAEYRLNELNEIYISFLKAVRDNRGYRLYQIESKVEDYHNHKNRVLDLIKNYRSSAEFNQDSVSFAIFSQLIQSRFKDLDAQLVKFNADPTYQRSKKEIEDLESVSSQLEKMQEALVAYWTSQSQQASEDFDEQKLRNDQLFFLGLLATIILTLLLLYTFKRKINSQLRHALAEETLAVTLQNEQEFSTAFDYASIGMALVSPKGDWLRVNRSLIQLLGYTEEELMKLTFQDITHPEDLSADLEYVHQMLRKEIETYQMEKRYFTKQGELVWAILSVSLVWEEEKPKHFISQIQNITIRKKLQNQLQTEKQRLQQVIEGTDAGTWEWNVQTGETIFNEKWANIIGYSLKDLGPTTIDTWIKFLLPEDRKASNQRLRDCFEGKSEIYESTYPMRHQSGELIWVMDRGKVMSWTADGKPERMFGSHIDITSIKRLEASLVVEHKKLEAKNEELEGFAAIAAHDLKEPLRMISMFMERLSQKYENQLDDTAKKYIYMAADGAKRMNALINDLLSYAELGGAGEASFEQVDLNQVFGETVALKAAILEEKNALVTKTYLPKVWGHKTAMKLLFQNLIGNGLKYQKSDNQPLIEVSFSENEEEYTLGFKDNGIGISEQNHLKVFNLFSRLHNKSEFAGTGMGLATCQKIVTLHQGKIWVESVLGQGSTFYFSLPKPLKKNDL